MRILLIGAAVFLAAWFTVLKPGAAEELPPVTPANTAPAAGSAANAAATPGAAEDTAVADTAIPADVLATLPKDVAKAIKARKTLVLGVFTDDGKSYRPMADDDRYVRNALKKTNRYDGDVFAKNIGVGDLVDYAPLVNDLGVKQSPAVVVIDRDLKGTVLTGYVDRIAINQAIADARRNSINPYITDDFLRAANAVCSRVNVRGSRWSRPTIPGKKARAKATLRLNRLNYDTLAELAKLQPPAKYSGLVTAWKKSVRYHIDFNRRTAALVKSKGLAAAAKHVATYDEAPARKLDRRFDAAGLTSCVGNRRS